jgi:hypothetical protein
MAWRPSGTTSSVISARPRLNSFPVRASGDFYKIGVHEYRIFNSNLDQPQDNLLLAFMSYFLTPATLEGTVFLVHEPLDQVKTARSAWIYNAGQRRVRRAPDLSYDNIVDGTEGMRVNDQFDAWNGAPDRYDWKLVGRRDPSVQLVQAVGQSLKSETIRKNTVNSDLMRYELHRVWEVEANLKAGSKHIYGKRVFYLDEDTWTVVYEDAYDTRKQLWRVAVHPMIQFYDAKVPWYRANIWHDLNSNYCSRTTTRSRRRGFSAESRGATSARRAASPRHALVYGGLMGISHQSGHRPAGGPRGPPETAGAGSAGRASSSIRI